MPPADGRTLAQARLLVAFHLTHVERGDVGPTVGHAHLRGALRVGRARVARVARVRAAGGLAHSRGLEPHRAGARRERERHHGRGHEHFPRTHRRLLLVDELPAALARDPHGPDLFSGPVVILAAYLSPSGRNTVDVRKPWGLAGPARSAVGGSPPGIGSPAGAYLGSGAATCRLPSPTCR